MVPIGTMVPMPSVLSVKATKKLEVGILIVGNTLSRLIISALSKSIIENFGIVSGFNSVIDKKQKQTSDFQYFEEKNKFICLTYFQRCGMVL